MLPLRETAIDLHVGVMAVVGAGRTYVQKVSVTKKVSKNTKSLLEDLSKELNDIVNFKKFR